MLRLRAIFCCLYFGIIPWQLYERDKCHYEGFHGGYWGHLKGNLITAWNWVTFQDDEEDHDFEGDLNPSWGTVWDRSNRWTTFRRKHHHE